MQEDSSIEFLLPTSYDGYAVNQLIADSPPLDTNSVYCNILQCYHFAETSVCAKSEGELFGFISGYLIPQRPDTLFIWQVVVSNAARGKGVASRMLNEILNRPACKDVKFLETTVTPTNHASVKLFERLASKLNAKVEVSPVFLDEEHFHGEHETEQLYRIGPFS